MGRRPGGGRNELTLSCYNFFSQSLERSIKVLRAQLETLTLVVVLEEHPAASGFGAVTLSSIVTKMGKQFRVERLKMMNLIDKSNNFFELTTNLIRNLLKLPQRSCVDKLGNLNSQ